jgi:protein TonB
VRRRSFAPERRSSVRRALREAFAISLAVHFCAAYALLKLRSPSSVPPTFPATPVEVRLVDDKPLATVHPNTAHQPTESNPIDQAPNPRKRPIESAPFASSRPQAPTEASSATPSMPVVTPRSPLNDDTGLPAPERSVTAPSGGPRGTPAGESFAGQAPGWNQGNPQWESLRAAIQRRVVYPEIARRMGWKGKVIVAFVLEKEGLPHELRIHTSSGNATLDSNALQAVERAAPLPLADETVQIVMPIEFALR